MQDVDLREVLALIPTRHIVIAMVGSIPLGLGLMGYFAPPEQGVISWVGSYAGPLIVFGFLMGLPLYWSSARAGMVLRRRMREGAQKS